MAERIPLPGEEREVKLTRSLGLVTATMLGVGAMIGAGIFILSGLAAGTAGPAATVSYVIVGIMTLFTALSYCELAAAIPVAGGGYTFVHEAIGGFTAFSLRPGRIGGALRHRFRRAFHPPRRVSVAIYVKPSRRGRDPNYPSSAPKY
jgi:amino acid transporter